MADRKRGWDRIPTFANVVPWSGSTLPLAQAANAHRAMEDRASYGKIVLITAFGERFINDNSVAEG